MSETTPPDRPKIRALRWITIAILLVGSGFGLVSGFFRECATTRAESSSGVTVTTVCAAPTLSSATVLIGLVSILLLAWPDLSELGVLGLTMKRRVAAAEHAAEEAKREVEQLTHVVQLQNVRVAAASESAASATQTFNNNNYWGTAESAGLAQLKPVAEPSGRPQRGNVYELTGRLALGWERLRGMLGLDARLQVPTILSKEPQITELFHARRSFVDDYSPQLATLRELRNAAVHSESVPLADLKDGVELLADITRRAEEWLPDSREGSRA